MSRQCGNCTACCLTHAVFDLKPEKPMDRWCQYCNQGRGCNIYNTKPQSCSDFQCEWLKGCGGQKDRPDRMGVVVTFNNKSLLEIMEARKGALCNPEVIEMTLAFFEANIPVLHVYLSGRKVLFANELSEELRRQIELDGGEILPNVNP